MQNIKRLHVIAFSYGINFTSTVFTLYLLANAISLEQVIVSQIIYAIASFAGEIPSGMLSDKLGHKKLITFAYGMLIISPLLMLISPSALMLYIGQALNGLAGAGLSGSQEALYYDSYHQEKGSMKGYKRSFAKFSSLPILGFILSSVLAGLLLQLFNQGSYRPLYIMNALSAAITTMLAIKLHHTFDQTEVKDESPIKLFKESIATVRGNKLLFSLAMFGLLSLNGEYFLRQTYQPHFQQANVLPLFMGLVLAIGSALNYLVTRHSYKLEKYLNLEHILLLHSLAQGLFFIALGSLGAPWPLVVVFILLFGMFNAQNPIVSDYVNTRISSGQRATVLSTISFIRQLGQTGIRFAYVFLVGTVGVATSYKIQGLYLIIGGLIGYWLLVKCGCSYAVPEHASNNPSLQHVATAQD